VGFPAGGPAVRQPSRVSEARSLSGSISYFQHDELMTPDSPIPDGAFLNEFVWRSFNARIIWNTPNWPQYTVPLAWCERAATE
jgi:hypothetical protein